MHRYRTIPTAITLTLIGIGCNSQAPDPTPPPSPASIEIEIDKELMITDLSVVESPQALDPHGEWTFGRVFRDLAASDSDAKEMLIEWLTSWEEDVDLNGDTAADRPTIRGVVIDPWKARDGQAGVTDPEWDVNWNHAPFRLLAIVNRIDLRRSSPDGSRTAGEGRFVFGLHDNRGIEPSGSIDNGGEPLPFTVIFEYSLAAETTDDVLAWARDWHELGSLEFGPELNERLLDITRRFAGRGAMTGRPNGSALNQLRTNEVALRGPWDLREFRLMGGPKAMLKPDTVKQSPANRLNNSAELARFITEHAENLSKGTLFINPQTIGQNFLGAASEVPFGFVWDAPDLGADLADARHGLAFQSCNGCHHAETGLRAEVSQNKTGAGFVHIAPRPLGQEAPLSSFLTGVCIPDPVSGKIRDFGDLESRANGNRGLRALLSGEFEIQRLEPESPVEARQFRVH